MSEQTTAADVLGVAFWQDGARGVRAAVGRNVPWHKFRDRIDGEIVFLLESAWHLRGTAASHYDGMTVEVDGVVVATVDSKGLDFIDDDPRDNDPTNLIDWVWPNTFESGGAVTVGQIVAATKVGTIG